MTAAPLSGRLTGLVGARWPLLAGLVIGGAAMLGLLRLTATTPVGAIWWNFALLGAGIGMSGTPGSSIAMSAVSAERAGMASALNNASRQIGQVFGVAVLGALVYAGVPRGTGIGGRFSPPDQTAFVTGLHHAVWVSGLALLAAAGLAGLLFTRRARCTRPAPGLAGRWRAALTWPPQLAWPNCRCRHARRCPARSGRAGQRVAGHRFYRCERRGQNLTRARMAAAASNHGSRCTAKLRTTTATMARRTRARIPGMVIGLRSVLVVVSTHQECRRRWLRSIGISPGSHPGASPQGIRVIPDHGLPGRRSA